MHRAELETLLRGVLWLATPAALAGCSQRSSQPPTSDLPQELAPSAQVQAADEPAAPPPPNLPAEPPRARAKASEVAIGGSTSLCVRDAAGTSRVQLLAALDLPVDYAVLLGPKTRFDEIGEACQTAVYRESCQERLAAAIESPSAGSKLVYSAGDSIGSVVLAARGERALGAKFTNGSHMPDAVRALVGPVDSPQKAALALWSVLAFEERCAIERTANGWRIPRWEGAACHITGRARNGSHEVDVNGQLSTQVGAPIRCPTGVMGGRLACGVQLRRHHEQPPARLGELLAEMAQMEAASVHAFVRIERELRRFGAPPELLQRVHNAQKDERRHARSLRAQAKRYGGAVRAPTLHPEWHQPRSLFELALENEREGCVGESVAALWAWEQASQAEDPQLAEAMGAIAHDETEHAALSFALAQWARTQLSAPERAALDAARAHALTAQRERTQSALGPHERALFGLPDARRAELLLQRLADLPQLAA